MNGRLFNRIVRVVAQQQPPPSSFVGKNRSFFEVVDVGIEIDKLRIEFDVTQNLGSEPNKCEIKIFNLSPDDRAYFDRKPTKVTLLAGYDNVPRLLFTGDLVTASTERVAGVDNVTTITVSDGMRAYAHARMRTKSYKPPMTWLRILQDCAATWNQQLPDELLKNAELKQSIAAGVSVHGPTRDIVTRILASYGIGWSFQNGKLVTLSDGEARPGDIVPVNEDTGLLNSPKVTAPEAASASGKGKPSEIKFDMLLYPELAPGKQVRIESAFLSATAKVVDVKHSGNNRDGKYMSSATAKVV